MEQIFYRVHVRTVTVWSNIAGPQTRRAVEKIALVSSLISIGFLAYMHFKFVGNNLDGTCFLNEMGTNVSTMKEYDIINIHISRDWSKFHSENLALFDLQKYGPLIYDEFTTLMGLHYDESSKNDVRLDSRSILNSVLIQLQEAITSNPSLSSLESLPVPIPLECNEVESACTFQSPSANIVSLPQFESLLYDRVYLYSSEKAYLMLPPDKRKRHNITTFDLILPATSPCFGIPPVAFAIYNLIGYDTIVINLMNELYGGRGQIYNIYSKQIFTIDTLNSHYIPVQTDSFLPPSSPSTESIYMTYFQRFVSYFFLKLGLLFASIFLFFTMTTIVSYILNQTQSKMLKFTFLLQYHVQHNIPYGTVVLTHVVESLVFVPIMVGILFFLFEFFRDQLLSFLILSLVWTCEVYSVMSLRTYLSMKYFPRLIFFYFLLLHLYLFSYPFGFSYIALYTNYCCDFHLMLYFFNYIEIPAYEAGFISAVRPRYIYPAMNNNPVNPIGAQGTSQIDVSPTPSQSLTLETGTQIEQMAQTNVEEVTLNDPPTRPGEIDDSPLGQVEYLSVDADDLGSVTQPIRRPLEEILAAESAILHRQRQIPIPDADVNSLRTVSDESTQSGYDSAFLLYGTTRNEETLHAPTSNDQIQLSREIQRQQMEVEMGFQLPSPLPSLPSVSQDSNQQQTNETSPSQHSGGERLRARKGPISSFFSNMFNINKGSSAVREASSALAPISEATDSPIAPPSKTPPLSPPRSNATSPRQQKEDDDLASGYHSLFKRQSLSIFRPRSHSEDLTNIPTDCPQHSSPNLSPSRPQSIKHEVQNLCRIYDQKAIILKQKYETSLVTIPKTVGNLPILPRSSSTPAIMTKLTFDELICPMTPQQIQLIRRRRKNLGNCSSEAVVAAVTRARAMSGTSSLGDLKSENGNSRERSQSNASIQSNHSGHSLNSLSRERVNSDRSASGMRYLTPQQQQLLQRKSQYQQFDNFREEDEYEEKEAVLHRKHDPVTSITSSLYNLIIRTVRPDEPQPSSQSILQSEGNSRDDRSDSNTTTQASSTSNQSDHPRHHESIPQLEPVFSHYHYEQEVGEVDDGQNIEHFYEESKDFSLFGVHFEDEEY